MGNSNSQTQLRYQEEAKAARRRAKLERAKKRISSRRSSSPPQFENECRFHLIHGINITITHEGRVATRTNSYCSAIAFTSRPIRVGEKVRVRLRKVEGDWSGVMRFGFSSNDPFYINPTDLPRYACPDLTSKHGYWARALPAENATEDNILTFYVDIIGRVFYSINDGTEQMVFANVDVSGSLWGLFDIYGNTTSLEILESSNDTQTHLDHRISAHIQLPPNMMEIAKDRLGVSAHVTPICFSATMGLALKCRNRVQVTRKDGIADSCAAFTDTGLRAGQTAYFYCAECKDNSLSLMDATGFGIGVTTCDPTSVIIGEIPFDSAMLMDRPEYWVFFRELEPPQEGEYFAITVEKEGCISYTREATGKSTLFHVDNSQPLYLLFDLCSAVSSLAIVGMSTELDSSDDSDDDAILTLPSLPALSFLDGNSAIFRNSSLSESNSGGEASTSRYPHEDLISSIQNPPQMLVQQPTINPGAATSGGTYPHETEGTEEISEPQDSVSSLSRDISAALGMRGIATALGLPMPSSCNNTLVVDLPSDSSSDSDDDYHPAQDEIQEPVSSDSSDDSLLEIFEDLHGSNDQSSRDTHDGSAGDTASPPQIPSAISSNGATNMTENPARKPEVSVAPVNTKEEKTEEKNEPECVICCDNLAKSVIYPCGHACLCFNCGQVLLRKAGAICPICRAKIKDVIRIYQS